MTDEVNGRKRITPVNDNGGIWVTLGNAEYQVPPLNFKALRSLAAEIEPLVNMEVGSIPRMEQLAIIVKLAHAALSRNYPELSFEEVEDRVDMGNFNDVLSAVISASGMRRRSAEAGKGIPAP